MAYTLNELVTDKLADPVETAKFTTVVKHHHDHDMPA
jgi:hypothetical protein